MKTSFNILALVSAIALQTVSLAEDSFRLSPLVKAGGGFDHAENTGTHLLLKVEAGLGTDSNPCELLDAVCQFHQAQMVIVHIKGEAAVDNSEDGIKAFPRIDLRFTPVAYPLDSPEKDEVTKGWIGKKGQDQSFHWKPFPGKLERDPLKEIAFRVSLVGFEETLQTFPADVLGFHLNLAADFLGYQYLQQNASLGPNAPHNLNQFSLFDARAEMGFIFAPSQSFVFRLLGGVENEYLHPIEKEIVSPKANLELFTQLQFYATRIFEFYGKVAWERPYIQEYDGEKWVTRYTGGLNVKYDWDGVGNW